MEIPVVGVARIELATPAMSTQCSTTELHAHTGRQPLAGVGPACKREFPYPEKNSAKASSAVRAEHPVDFQHQLTQVKRLRKDLCLRNGFSCLPRDGSKSIDEHDANFRPNGRATDRQSLVSGKS